MTSGDAKLVDLPETLKKNPRTKGAYSKRKAVYQFIQQYPGGPGICIPTHGHLTTTHIHDQYVNKSRK